MVDQESVTTRIHGHGYVHLVHAWGSDEGIVAAARMSTDGAFRGWGTAEEPGDERLLARLWRDRHTSPFEQAGLTVEVRAPLFVIREWQRHRTQSYNEQSARYGVIPADDYLPTLERVRLGGQSTTNRQGSGAAVPHAAAEHWRDELAALHAQAERVYRLGVESGISRELARLALTVSRYSRMRASANLRNWLAFLALRLAPDAQEEIRDYARAVAALVAERFPRTWALAEGDMAR